MSSRDGTRYVLVQTVAPHYRQAFFDGLCRRFGKSLQILSGSEYFSSNLKTEAIAPCLESSARNFFFAGRRVLFQWGVFFPALNATVAVLEYNPRIMNSWLVSVTRSLLGRKTIFWGHALSRKGVDNLPRAWLRFFSDAMIVYTEEQKSILKQTLGYKGEVFAAPNAVFRSCEMEPVPSQDRRSFLYSGRLVKEKKPLLLVSAFAKAIPGLPVDSKLLVVGDGPERASMERLAADLGVTSRVEFLGQLSDYATLRSLYERSLATVSPGYVGLSITQSLGFGVPMIYGKDEPHSVEIVCARPGWNSLAFDSDSDDALALAMAEMSRDRNSWVARASEISDVCKEKYSIESMVEGFASAILSDPGASRV